MAHSSDAESSKRLISLDVFRGITIGAMIFVNNTANAGRTYPQLVHAPWNGWTLTDLIFPFFLFIVGVATVCSLSKPTEVPEEIDEETGEVIVPATILNPPIKMGSNSLIVTLK